MDKASNLFSMTAKESYRERRSLLPFVAFGIHSFKSKDFRKSLASYIILLLLFERISSFSYVLKRLGSKKCPKDVRVAIGFCFFQMGQFETASKIFKRYPSHLGAIYGRISIFLKKYSSKRHHRVRFLPRLRKHFLERKFCKIDGMDFKSDVAGGLWLFWFSITNV